MSLQEVAGATYGPYSLRISPEKVAEYVAATGDEPDRWVEHAPPSFAGALLFVAAPHFLRDPRVRPYTGVLVHVDQSFTWHTPLGVGTEILVTGSVDQVRERSGRFFVSFTVTVETDDGDRLLDAAATFLMGEGTAQEGAPDDPEPAVWRRELNDLPSPQPWPGVNPLPGLSKSASRLDLVKYAAASGDYNPIHFDHDSARAAGLPGIVVHGLLMAAWAMQAAGAVSGRPDPIAHTKLRFRNPLRPAVQATVSGMVGDVAPDEEDAQVKLKVSSPDQDLVTGVCVVRLSG
ncbi:MAG: MaoC/PaaZ C-terminal domain-containing protein [Acidimicrobiia bacterium]|nr:MaoC/PaaZ C-terminal domain-containing protein [Acidimicrobiia bacterium]